MPDKLTFSFDDESIDGAHDALQDRASEPNRAAIDSAAAERETAEKDKAKPVTEGGQTDSEGTVFNAELHAVDKDGNPSLTSRGKFRKKRGASKVATQAQVTVDQQKRDSARAAGQLAADMIVQGSIMLGGEDWIPVGSKEQHFQKDYDEHAHLRKAFADYFEAKGWHDFPPGLAFGMALTSYAGPRLAASTETHSRMQKAKAWFKGIAAKLRGKKNGTQPDSRDNGKREIDTSKEAGGKEPDHAARGSGTRPA